MTRHVPARGAINDVAMMRVLMRARLLGFPVLLIALLLAGCSSTPHKAFSAVNLTPGKPVPLDLAHNARSDLQVKSCQRTSSGWQLDGTVKNPSSATTSFQIVVDFVTSKGDTVLATTEVNVTGVSAGSSVDWTATGAPGKTGVSCLVRQAQTT